MKECAYAVGPLFVAGNCQMFLLPSGEDVKYYAPMYLPRSTFIVSFFFSTGNGKNSYYNQTHKLQIIITADKRLLYYNWQLYCTLLMDSLLRKTKAIQGKIQGKLDLTFKYC
ncbi:hypothetical protein XENTR_v10020934 [Xenopus tropicalis]|nr:hypothetical protein XENTR_v10020934 [Xenopus tropicalis]